MGIAEQAQGSGGAAWVSNMRMSATSRRPLRRTGLGSGADVRSRRRRTAVVGRKWTLGQVHPLSHAQRLLTARSGQPE